ncbi:MAG: DUF6051 family protein [Bacteroidales bacterium]
MDYTDNQILLKGLFRLDQTEIRLPETDVRIVNCSFRSPIQPVDDTCFKETMSDPGRALLVRQSEANSNFTYPVFMPEEKGPAQGAIILLHGLNERQWNKYLYWAQYLCEQTGKAVILFPIAFHINRSPEYWSDPRLMSEVSLKRTTVADADDLATPFNAALSTRLEKHPEWFCTSGLQSCYDIISLSTDIRDGRHPLFEAGTRTDFFAYSVGAFLLEVLLLANPDGLFSRSRSFLFLGGSTFEQMRGVSRYIMDRRAYDRLDQAFLRQDPAVVRNNIHLPRLSSFNQLWTSFLSVLKLDLMAREREESFRSLSDRISAVGLARDRVIPGGSILATLRGNRRPSGIPVRIMDFPYPYIHENPFPVTQPDIRRAVDSSFRDVFGQASRFLRA